MSEEEISNILDELNNVRPEVLNEESKRLFNAIMQIADERDKYINLAKKQTQLINLMAEGLTTPIHDKEWIIKYYEEMIK